jgi:hypothetical protein
MREITVQYVQDIYQTKRTLSISLQLLEIKNIMAQRALFDSAFASYREAEGFVLDAEKNGGGRTSVCLSQQKVFC